MPNTCRTETFMSGRPVMPGAEDSCTLVVAAVVINPPRSGRSRKQIFANMAADGCWSEPIREQDVAEARGPIKVPLLYHQDRGWCRFLEGCPANHAVLSFFRPAAHSRAPMALSTPIVTYVRSSPRPDNAKTGILWLPSSIP